MAFLPLFPEPKDRLPVDFDCTCTMCKERFLLTPATLTFGRATLYREDVEKNQVGLYGTWCGSCTKIICDLLLELGALGLDK